jgi:hypothetical protein
MPTYDNKNRGAMFKNDRKGDGDDKKPDYTGKVEIERAMLIDLLKKTQGTNVNITLFVSAWVKQIQNGERTGQRMLSLAVQPPREKPADAPPREDDIPF